MATFTTTVVEWSTADLACRVERGLDVASAAISLVATEDPKLDLAALEAPPDKIIAETAMLLRAASAVPYSLAPGVSERAHKLVRTLLPHARHRRIALRIALHPSLALDYGAAHILLSNIGYPDSEFDRALSAVINSPVAVERERLPHRELEQKWLASLLAELPIPHDLVTRTAVVRGIDLLTGSRDDVYALTHALLYVTDFGNRRFQLPISVNEVIALVRSALAGALDEDDFDLAGELLLTWPFLGADWDPSSTLAFAVLARVEDEVGVLPSLALDRAGYEQQPAESRKNYVAALAYHTAYVMALLCSVILRSGSFPNRHLATAGTSGSIVFTKELLALLSAGKRQPQWLRNIDSLPEPSLPAYASFLLDMALRRAVRRLDFADIRRLLEGAVENKVALSPLCRQAAEVLRRIADCQRTLAHVVSL